MFILEIYSQMAESILAAARSFAGILENKFEKTIEKLDKQAAPTIFDFDQQTQKFNLFDEKLLDDFNNLLTNYYITSEDVTDELRGSILNVDSD